MIISILIISKISLAEQLVILDSSESKTPEVTEKLAPAAEYLTWTDLQDFPLAFGSIQEHKTCLGNPTTLESLRKSLKSAESAVAYLETQNALGHIRQIENKLPCLQEAIPQNLLVRSNYIAGVAYNYDENTDMAKASWRKALMYNPDLDWDDNIEPSGKGAFEDVKRNVQSQATTSLVLIPSNAAITVDGTLSQNGDTIIAGEHLVQHNALSFQGHSITTEMGSDAFIVSFADFPNDLNIVMSEDSTRQAMLKGLLMVQDKSDIRVVTKTDYWYLPMGTSKWKSQPLNNSNTTNVATIQTTTTPKKPKNNPFKIDKPWFYSGAGLLVVGGGAFMLANSQASLFDSYDENASEEAIQGAYNLNHTMWWTGTVLTTVGGGLILKGSISF